jgi:predicted transglutaminase-like cysteine proteinase
MDAKEANKTVAAKFQYITDKKKYGFFETWSIMDMSKEIWEGDCEDYSLTVLWLMSGEKTSTFVKNVLFNRDYRMHFVKYIRTGEGHAVLSYKGEFCDNIQKKWFKEGSAAYKKYDWKWPVFGPLVIINLLIGKIVKKVKRG